jgi:hypothetical protein
MRLPKVDIPKEYSCGDEGELLNVLVLVGFLDPWSRPLQADCARGHD